MSSLEGKNSPYKRFHLIFLLVFNIFKARLFFSTDTIIDNRKHMKRTKFLGENFRQVKAENKGDRIRPTWNEIEKITNDFFKDLKRPEDQMLITIFSWGESE